MAVEFRVRPRSSAGRSFRFVSDLDRILVGRGEVCDLRIPYPAVSFHHATIRRTNAGWELADNGSTNGTWHRGRRVHPGESVRLATGDRVAIPGFVIETRFTPGPAADGPSDPEALGREIYAALLRPDLAEEGPRLEVEAGPFAGRSLALPPRDAPYVVGRDPECDWEIPDREASRRHLVVSSDGRRARVLDEGSKNGVRVNGRVVREAILRDGDSVEVGRTVLTFRDPRGGTLARLSSETGDRSALCDGFAALERGEEAAATLPPGGAGATGKDRGGPGGGEAPGAEQSHDADDDAARRPADAAPQSEATPQVAGPGAATTAGRAGSADRIGLAAMEEPPPVEAADLLPKAPLAETVTRREGCGSDVPDGADTLIVALGVAVFLVCLAAIYILLR